VHVSGNKQLRNGLFTKIRRRMMEEENGQFGCELDVLLGYDDWSEVPDDWSEEPEAAMPRDVGDCGIGFNLRGPGNLSRMEKITVESSDGFDMDVDRLYTWAPAPDQVGHSVAEVEEFVNRVFRDSKSWMAAGIALRRVPSEQAQCIVKYVAAPLQCAGESNAAGCTTVVAPGRKLIRMVRGTFGAHKGLMHELAHAFGGGRHNLPQSRWETCPSVMGGPAGIWPTPSDISSTRRWAHS
jgi:hypothetical protein